MTGRRSSCGGYAGEPPPAMPRALVDMFRVEENACLLGTDAVRDGVDVPGRSLRLLVFDRVPWPRPSILHRERRIHLSGGEPTARDDIVDITATCARLGLYSNLITSGVGKAIDKLQALYDDAAAALQAAVTLADDGSWHVGLGVGEVDRPLADAARENTGAAFVAAREAVQAAKDAGGPAVRGGEWAERAGALLGLLCAVRERRTDSGAAAVALAETGMTQQQMAEHLGITQSSVSRRLDAALWHQEHAAREALTAVLALADGTAAPPRGSPTRTATPPATAASGGHGRSARQDAPDEGTNASSARAGRGDGA